MVQSEQQQQILSWVKSFVIFWYMLVCSMYIKWLKQFKLWKVLTAIGSIVVAGVLTSHALLHFVYDLKAALMNVQHCLILQLTFYDFELGNNIAEATRNICWIKSGDHSTVNKKKMVEEILLGLQKPQWSGKVRQA